MESLKKQLQYFNELVMFQHSIFSLPFIFIAMIVSSGGFFGWKLLLLGVLAAVTARNFAMAVNRYVDRDIDKENPRTASRPSVDGRLNKDKILAFIIINAFIFIATASVINTLALVLSIPILVILASYSYFKRFNELAHLILGVSLGLAPIAGVVAVEASIPLWSLLLSFGVLFWVAGFDLLYSLQDIDFDKEKGLYSIPSIYGKKATMFISQLFHGITIIFWLLFAYGASLGFFGYLAVIFSGVILFKEHQIVNKDFNKIDKAFFTLNGYLGIMFLILIIIDQGF